MENFNNGQQTPTGGYYTPPQYTPNQVQNQQSPYPQQPQQPYTPPVYTPPVAPVPPNGKPPKKKKNKAVIIIAIILVIAFIISVAAIASYKNVTNSDSSSSSQSEDKDPLEFGNNTDENAGAKIEGSNEAATKDKNGNYTVAGVAKETIDSCVLISVYADVSAYNYFYGYGFDDNNSSSEGSMQLAGEGSGVIMSESKGTTYIMTAAHVIETGDKFTVTTNDGKEYTATRVGFDSQTDIGVLAIKATGLKVAKFGNSKDIQIGEQCVVIGCPNGSKFMNSVTTGIVSALDRPMESKIGYNNNCIQTDAAINPGNSGGAMFNMQGQVIGINSSKIASTEYEGMGFAVPSNTAVETANSLIKNGYVSGRAILGIKYNEISNYQSADNIIAALAKKGYKNANGVMVIQEVDEKSDLKGKVEQYDMIVAVDSKTMTSTDVMTNTLSKKKPGQTVKLTIATIENNSLKISEITCKLIENTESN